MDTNIRRSNLLRFPLVFALLASAGACAHVNQKDLDSRLETLRGDLVGQIADGDQRTAAELGLRMDQSDARIAALRADLNTLEQDFDMKVALLEDALRFDVPVYFGFDKAEVQATGREVLARFGQVADKYYPDAQITVEGFADPSGSEAYNRALGQRRADAVRSFLVAQGMSGDRIKSVSYGEDARRLVADGAHGPGSAGWENRRVVLVIDHAGSMTPAATVAEGSR